MSTITIIPNDPNASRHQLPDGRSYSPAPQNTEEDYRLEEKSDETRSSDQCNDDWMIMYSGKKMEENY